MAHLQGAVPLTDPTYVKRSFEFGLVRLVAADRWALLLGPRQHGKTSALIRLKQELASAGYACCLVDLQAAPPCATYGEFVGWFAIAVANQVGVELRSNSWNDVAQVISSCDPGGGKRLVVLVDEASNIPSSEWRNAFYGQIRAISGLRAESQTGDIFSRITFVFSGTFRPETLIDAENSPFNVCEIVETTDFTLEETEMLCRQAGVLGSTLPAQKIYEHCEGHPYLTQRLLDSYLSAQSESAIDSEVDELIAGNAGHIRNLFSKIVSDPPIDRIVRRMVSDGYADMQPADPDYKFAQTVGIAKRDGARLFFRNRIYQAIAGSSPQLGLTADESGPLFRMTPDAFASIQDERLREFAASAHAGAISAYTAGSFRLSLIGFGSLLEAYLIDYLERCDLAKRGDAFQACNTQRTEQDEDPRTWRLVTMIAVAKDVSGLARLNITDTVREWRNYVHPAATLRAYVPNDQLEIEVRIVSAIFDLVRRDLS